MLAKPMLENRFEELESQAQTVEVTKRRETTEFSSGDYVDATALLNWKVKVRALLGELCAKESEYYRQFVTSEKAAAFITNYDILKSLRAIFAAAHDDYRNGYLNKFQAEVFDSELEQAKSLFDNGYLTAAAVIAGVVLETTLRQLCIDRSMPLGKLDKMNADLAKANAYKLQTQKRITAIADIRNNAAHGHSDKYTAAEVSDMIAYINNFVEEQL